MNASTATRLAIVQHGDWLAARRLVHNGEPEPYFGMTGAVHAIEELLGDRAHCLISLDAPAGVIDEANGTYVNLPRPPRSRWLLASMIDWQWSARMISHLDAFRPTHLLLRTGGIPALRLLRWADARGIEVFAIFANYFSRATWRDRLLNEALARQLNRSNVVRVGNHRWPATETMIECGLDPRKANAWDWSSTRSPHGHAVKSLSRTKDHEILYVGAMLREKGVFDLMNAVQLLRRRQVPIRLTMVGDGPHAAEARQFAARNPEVIHFTGRISNQQAFERMEAADLVCIPSRPEFSEGFPLTLTEALASRTPVLVSTHPVFTRAFPVEEGVRFFASGNPIALADAAQQLLQSPALYHQVSKQAETAFERVACKNLFADLLRGWELP